MTGFANEIQSRATYWKELSEREPVDRDRPYFEMNEIIREHGIFKILFAVADGVRLDTIRAEVVRLRDEAKIDSERNDPIPIPGCSRADWKLQDRGKVTAYQRVLNILDGEEPK